VAWSPALSGKHKLLASRKKKSSGKYLDLKVWITGKFIVYNEEVNDLCESCNMWAELLARMARELLHRPYRNFVENPL